MADGETHHSLSTQSSLQHIHLWPSSFTHLLSRPPFVLGWPPIPPPSPFLPFTPEQKPLCHPSHLLSIWCLSFTKCQQNYLQRQMQSHQHESASHMHRLDKMWLNSLTSQLSDSADGLSRPAKNSSTQSILRMPFAVIERDRATVPRSLYHKGLSALTWHSIIVQPPPASSSTRLGPSLSPAAFSVASHTSFLNF